MHRKNKQDRITGKQKIQKKICRIPLMRIVIFIMAAWMMTGCGGGKTPDTEELIQVREEDSGQSNADSKTSDREKEKTEKNSEKQKEAMTENICYVHVCGAVKSPGVYELMPDSRLYEAIQMAGGLTGDAAGEALNQAERIEDGSRIYVPTKDEAGNGITESGDVAGNAADDGKVNINTAAKEQLMTLTGIGEAKAASIIRYREEHGGFQKIEDLMEVEGIKEGVFQKVKDQIKI